MSKERRQRRLFLRTIRKFSKSRRIHFALNKYQSEEDIPMLQALASGEKRTLYFHHEGKKWAVNLGPQHRKLVESHIEKIMLMSMQPEKTLENIQEEMEDVIQRAVPLHRKEEEE